MDHSTTILQEKVDPPAAQYVATVKWWADRLGYGFLTIVSPGPVKGKDVFVHHTSIRPLNSRFRTLRRGEYVSLDIIQGQAGEQAANVTGVYGGPLMCDVTPSMWPSRRSSSCGSGCMRLRRSATAPPPPPPAPQ